ncbi:MAG: response regulator [Cyclobacteriaceae bacterium]
MDRPIKILIVEDEMVIGANLSMQLSELGYDVCGLLPRGEDAISHVSNDPPDIIILDIQLKGKLDGIETAEVIREQHDIPVIFLTSNTDDHHFNRAKHVHPKAFIPKPYKTLDLKRAIELATAAPKASDQAPPKPVDTVLDDRIFVRHQDKLNPVMLEDIHYFEADRNYSHIHTRDQTFVMVGTLKAIEEKLTNSNFLRVHRSFVVNLRHVQEVATSHLQVGEKVIPITKEAKIELLRSLKTL